MKFSTTRIASDKEHSGLQFIKYGICGGLATFVDVGIFYILSLFFFPALGESDVVVKLLGDYAHTTSDLSQIERNFVLNSCFSFVGSNLIGYVLNAWLVFHSDKDSRHKELILFFAVSGASIAIGIFLGWVFVRLTGVASWGYLMKMISSVLLNFAGRKFLVFKYSKQAI